VSPSAKPDPASAGHPVPRPRPGAPGRSSEQIRNDIVAQREELAGTVEALRGRVTELTDWRRHIEEHKSEIVTGAAVVGFVIGGIFALRRRR
jgi:hypothetical protein